jgi:hypothetical protein
MWCLLFALPFAWQTLSDAMLDQCAVPLRICAQRDRAWLDMHVHQARADGLGALLPVQAWSASTGAMHCLAALETGCPEVAWRMECVDDARPAASWWNHTCMNDLVWRPEPATAAPLLGFGAPSDDVHPAPLYVGLVAALLVAWALSWAARAAPTPEPLPDAFVAAAPVAAPVSDDEPFIGLVRHRSDLDAL